MQFLLKVGLSALLIAVSSELAKRSAVYGAVAAGLFLIAGGQRSAPAARA